MSYIARDQSLESADPVFLYQFDQELTQWRYTSAGSDVNMMGQDWQAIAISHDTIKQSEEMSKSVLSITIDPQAEMCAQFDGWAPESDVTLTLYRGHHGEVETRAVWLGRIATHKRKNKMVQFSCELFYTSLNKTGVRSHVQLSCRHGLYSYGCGVNREAYKVSGTASAMVGQIITVSAASGAADGYYAGGVVTFPDGTHRTITNHVGDQLTLMKPSRYLADNGFPASVDIYPGCTKTKETCSSRFNNITNFGGFPWIPGLNPLGGISIV